MTPRSIWMERGKIYFCFLIIVLALTVSPVAAACSPGYQACNGMCYSCPSGTTLGSDCKCHQSCGSSNHYCISGTCCGGKCLSCPSGYILGSDCKCHEPCGSSGEYCTSGTCCNDRCLSCNSGYLGTDCECHNQISNSYDNSYNLTDDDKSNIKDAINVGKVGAFLAKIVKIILKIF